MRVRTTRGWQIAIGRGIHPPSSLARPAVVAASGATDRSRASRAAVVLVDLGVRDLRYAAEYDGEEAHEGREAQDEERRDWLRRHGWTVIVVRKGDFSDARRDRWIRELREALAPTYSNRRW